MSSLHYYNEIDPYCAAWLQNLMDAGHIPAGDIDTRSIEDVRPDELAGYVQCHFFAGIGGWPLALALAGWPVDRPVWTGSCPCQPFSAAGKGLGFEDERHLWPAWQHLIVQCRPPVLFGEQVASKDANAWIDLVHADLEGMAYAFGCVAFPAAGVRAPHIRERTYWVADTQFHDCGCEAEAANHQRAQTHRSSDQHGGHRGAPMRMADSHLDRQPSRGLPVRPGGQEPPSSVEPRGGQIRGMGNAHSFHAGRHGGNGVREEACSHRGRCADGAFGDGADLASGAGDACPTKGQWADADWLLCRDGKWRPVEPGTFPLAHGIPNRVGRLRAYGNAIVPQAAAAFITAYAEARGIVMESVKESQAC